MKKLFLALCVMAVVPVLSHAGGNILGGEYPQAPGPGGTLSISSFTSSQVNASTYQFRGSQMYGILYSSTTCVTASSGTTLGTFALTNSTITLTPHSTTSRIEVSVMGGCKTSNGGTDGCTVTVFRGSTDLSTVFAASGVGMAYIQANIAALLQGTVGFNFIDQPNTTSPVSYTVRIHSDAGGGTVTWNTGPVSCMTVKEWGY